MFEAIAGYLAVSFWATAGTAPLTAQGFNQFSIVGLIANAVVVPIMGFGGTVIGLLACALSLVWMPPATVLMLISGRLIAIGNLLAEFFVRLPAAWIRTFTPTPIEMMLAYASLLLWLLWPMRSPDEKSQPPPSRTWHYALAAGLLIAIVADAGWWTRDRYLNPDLQVAFLSVGEGDAEVVRLPDSRVMLIDAGGAYHDYDMGERIVARYLWSEKIMKVDWLMLSHPDADHFGGFDFIARNFHPGAFWTGAASSTDASYAHLMDTLHELAIPIRVVDPAMSPVRADGAMLSIVAAPENVSETRNNSSVVMKATYDSVSVLFTGDLEAAGERAAIESGSDLRATVLKVPHHGSHTSSTPEFVAAVHPEVAIMSLGYNNRFHFPAPEVLERYRAIGAKVFRTDEDGAILLDAGTHGMRIECYGRRVLQMP
jgi:competence protein ComEC